MATIKELAESYYKDIKEAMPVGATYKSALSYSQQALADKIVRNIESLSWESSGRPLDLEDKEQIVKELWQIIHVKEADNANYLALVNYITAQLQAAQGRKR